ncbi:MAG TPA: hypothetical protein VM282_14895 [Acidimicrobiales bacterium]|nr:hypothetical protein [Acidimicrobiales bacterium]
MGRSTYATCAGAADSQWVALSSTYAVRLGSIVAGIAWIILLLAPGSRAEDATRPEGGAVSAQARSDAPTTSVPPAAVVPTTVAPITVGPTTVPAPSAAPTTATPVGPVSTAPRVFSVRELVGVSIDRGATWIALATVTMVDQTGTPAAGVEVKATWSFENTPASCRSDTAGKCSMYRSGLPADVDAVTITITAPQNATKIIRREGVN